jgi:hypothetical protein
MKFVLCCLAACFALCLSHSAVAAQALPAALASAPSPVQALACAVEWRDKAPAPSAVCSAIGRSLGREVRQVDDARAIKFGDSVQVLDGEVFWITVWLRNGKVRAFTRVSKTLAQGKELTVLGNAVRTLSKTPARQKRCVRVEPNGGRKMRSPDLVYPWAELRRCKAQAAEVPDPWFEP